MSPLLASASEVELSYISGLDYGQDSEKHLEALRLLVFEQAGVPLSGQMWYPYEVIELGSHSLVPGHEREFAICTLLVVGAVQCGFDSATDLSSKFNDRAQEYDRLPQQLKDEILNAYQSAGC